MKPKYRFNIKRMTADCEANYWRLCQLLPRLAALAEKARTCPDRSLGKAELNAVQRRIMVELQPEKMAVLLFDLSEQCRFTTCLDIYFDLSSVSDLMASSLLANTVSMKLRLYHDVKLAEVISLSGKRLALASYQYPNDSMFMPDEKQQQNQFLSEWLSLCLQAGVAEKAEDILSFMNVKDAVNTSNLTDTADILVSSKRVK